MSMVSAVRPAQKTWLIYLVKTFVVLQALALIYVLTTPWITVAVAAAFIVLVSTVRARSRASGQVDTIFDDELDRDR